MTALASGQTQTARMSGGTILALIAMGISVIVLAQDFSAVNVALPAIERHFNTDISTVQWVINAYALVFGMLIVPGGRLADQFGRKRVFLIGAGIFAVTSLLAGVAPSIGWLIGARALTGCSSSTCRSPSRRCSSPGWRCTRRKRPPRTSGWTTRASPRSRSASSRCSSPWTSPPPGADGSAHPWAARRLPRAGRGVCPGRAAGGLVYMFQLAGGAIGLGVTTTIVAFVSRDRLNEELASLGATLTRTQALVLHGLLADTDAARAMLATLPPAVAERVSAFAQDAFVAGIRTGLRVDGLLALGAVVVAVLLIGRPVVHAGWHHREALSNGRQTSDH